MYYKKKNSVLFRNYESFGYITDNRNFEYKQIKKNDNYIGDKVLSESGAIFISVLDKKPLHIDFLVKEVYKQFTDVDYSILEKDIVEFYEILEQDGFIVSGETLEECIENDKMFSYKTTETIENRDTFINQNNDKTTQVFLNEYFDNKPQLTSLHIEITSICNERCIHCYIPHEYKVSYIEPDLFYDVLEQSRNMKLLHLTLSGGEPMLHKHFCDFIRKCKEYDFSVNVLSNLTLLNDEIINEMKANPLLGVQVSLYSMNSLIHDKITQMKGSFEKTKSAILELIEYDIPLQISCPIMKQNKNCYNEVIEWAKNHKIYAGDDFGLIAKYNHTTQNLNCRLSLDEIKEVINEKVTNDSNFIEQMKQEVDKKKAKTLEDTVCSVCHSSICVSDNGNVYPCAGWQDYVLGNVKETSLQEIWENSEKVQYLRGLRNKDFPKCIQCSDKEFCSMCMVKNANENSDGDPLFVNEFFCNIAKLNRHIMIEKNLI